ncbi:integrase core domain-containing protein [Kitasatospora sp. NPDC087314]|uniref:integrase core domain-containing protein n=1 Tax=Kitasatospora sp. NPDC087314 TaxID=3364068 RepID=UPI0038110666
MSAHRSQPMTDDQDRRLLPTTSATTPTERNASASDQHIRRWRRLIEHGTRRVHIAGVTRNVTSEWATQQARNLLMTLDDTLTAAIRYLIRDNAGYFTEAFDAVFNAIGAQVVPILPGVPRMNAIAERWVGSCRREATGRVLITGERHLRLVVDEYAAHHNEHRPHRSLGQRCPDAVGTPEPPAADDQSRVIRRDRLGGLIHEYAQVA